MKKGIVMLCLLLITIAVMPLMVNAEEIMRKEDSTKISEEIKNQLALQKDEEVIRIYNIPLRFAFTEYSNINEVLASNEVLQIYYAVKSTNELLVYKEIYDGGCREYEIYSRNQKAMNAFENDNIIEKISSDIIVYNTYYLSGESSHMGTAIYYVTNKGDYVYYNYYELGEGEYLFPIDAFCKYQKAIIDEYAKYPDRDGGISIDQLWDLSPYDINSKSFNPNAKIQLGKGNDVASSDNTNKFLLWGGISLGIVLLAAGLVCGGIYLHKKKASR